MHTRTSLIAVTAIALAACRAEPADDPATAAPPDAAPDAGAPDRGAWVASPTGIGPLRAGMTLDEARAALREPLPMTEGPDGSCGHAAVPGAPEGVFAMVVDGRIARIEVRRGDVGTTEGARIGDTEARIDSLYRGRVSVEPHKYTDGHYLVVTPAAPTDGDVRLIFETDGERVTEFRVGRLPQVGWVEGCS